MAKKQPHIADGTTDSFPINEIIESNPLFTRREMLGVTGMAGLAALAGPAVGAVRVTQQAKPRIAVLASYWGETRSHADWIVNKLIDGYWWDGAYKESRVEVASMYLHQHDTSQLAQKVAKAKGIPVYRTVAEALRLGGQNLAVDGVVIVAEHGSYPNDLKGHWLLPRWLLYSQTVRVFEQSQRSVPVFNDKHLSYNWDESKWMYDKSRELGFPLTGGSSIPVYYRKPEIEVPIDAPIKNSIVMAGTGDEGAIFHAIDVLQCFVERRRGGESGVKSIQSIRGPELGKWVDSNPWVDKLMAAITANIPAPAAAAGGRGGNAGQPAAVPGGRGGNAGQQPGAAQGGRGGNAAQPPGRSGNACIIEYNDGTKAAVLPGRGGWSWAGEIEGKSEPTVVSMLGWPGPFDQYHASNAQPHWITEMMVTKKEPFNAERLLLSSGITNWYMESNWENGKYSPVGRVIQTPFLNIKYKTTRGAQFSKGERPPARPYLRGFNE
jgi:hypothetical protein